jgi:negative regulator of sigma E activity
MENLSLLLQNYQVSVQPGGEILGHQVDKVALRPLYPGNPTLVLWVDTETSFPLRRERYNPHGELTSWTEFVSLEFSAPMDREKLVQGLPEDVEQAMLASPPVSLDLEEVQSQARFSVLIPEYVPPGYTFREALLLEEGRTIKLTYTNGLGVICLFQRPRAEVKMRYYTEIRVGKMGVQFRERGISRTLVWARNGVTYVLIGDVSREELGKMAASIQ